MFECLMKMRGKMFVLKPWIIVPSLFLCIALLVLIISGNRFHFMGTAASLDLRYILWKPRAPITLNLFEAERYEAAVVVQPLIGNLVYYSNFGRYQPRLAQKWERVGPNVWSFELHQ